MITICKADFFAGTMLLASVAIVATFSATELQAQDIGDTLKKSKHEPNVTITVNKKRDANGNITQYDSTYVSSWSGNNSMMPAHMDSVMRVMHERFFNDFQFGKMDSLTMPYGFNFQMNDSLRAFNDSTFFNPHFNEMFEDNFGDMEKMMRDHEKMMQQFFRQQRNLRIPNNIVPPTVPLPPQMPQKSDNSLKKEKMINRSSYQVNT